MGGEVWSKSPNLTVLYFGIFVRPRGVSTRANSSKTNFVWLTVSESHKARGKMHADIMSSHVN
jgi:hypothetical protein